MFNELARHLLRTRRQIDPELADVLGTEGDYVTFSPDVNLDYIPDQFARRLESAPSVEGAYDLSVLLESIAGLEKSDADRIAYANVEATSTLEKNADASRHLPATRAIVAKCFHGLQGLGRHETEKLAESCAAFVAQEISSGCHDIGG